MGKKEPHAYNIPLCQLLKIHHGETSVPYGEEKMRWLPELRLQFVLHKSIEILQNQSSLMDNQTIIPISQSGGIIILEEYKKAQSRLMVLLRMLPWMTGLRLEVPMNILSQI